MTSNCDVANSANQIQMNTPWKFSAYATAGDGGQVAACAKFAAFFELFYSSQFTNGLGKDQSHFHSQHDIYFTFSLYGDTNTKIVMPYQIAG